MKNNLWLIWKEKNTRLRYKVGVLKYENAEYTFQYTNPELDEALKVGFNYFPGFPNLKETYCSKVLFANIAGRLPNVKRPDYLEILNSYNLEANSSEWDILVATKGRLITDNYEFVTAFDQNKIEFDVAGTRYSEDIKKINNKLISVNDILSFEQDLNNKYDKYAIKIYLNKNGKQYHLGYVPKYYSKELTILLQNNIKYSAMVKSLNFESEISDEDITVVVKLIFNN